MKQSQPCWKVTRGKREPGLRPPPLPSNHRSVALSPQTRSVAKITKVAANQPPASPVAPVAAGRSLACLSTVPTLKSRFALYVRFAQRKGGSVVVAWLGGWPPFSAGSAPFRVASLCVRRGLCPSPLITTKQHYQSKKKKASNEVSCWHNLGVVESIFNHEVVSLFFVSVHLVKNFTDVLGVFHQYLEVSFTGSIWGLVFSYHCEFHNNYLPLT